MLFLEDVQEKRKNEINYNKFIEEKVLKISSKKNYEDYPNQMKIELQKQAEQNNFTIVSYNKNYYNLNAILKDINEDRYIQVLINDLSCFKDKSYSCVALRVVKNPNMLGGIVNRSCTWNEIGVTARRIIDLQKKKDLEQSQNIEMEKE